MTDYNRVALFVRVVKTGSFTAAAAEVGLPKSSVSRSVSALESDLGVRLLQRTTRKLALTEAGQGYYDAVSGSVSAMDEAEAAARERGAAPTGTVRITAAPDFSALAPVLAQFLRKYPGIRLDVMLTSRMVDLVTEGVDIAIRAGRLPDSSLVARRVGGSELVLMASPAYLRRRGRPKSIDDLAAHDWVLYRAPGRRAAVKLHGPGGERTIEVEGVLTADDMAFCRAAAEAGTGIALLPIQGVVDAAGAGRLERVLPGWTYGNASVYVVMPSGRYVPARVALVRDFLVEQIGRELARVEDLCARGRNTPLLAEQR